MYSTLQKQSDMDFDYEVNNVTIDEFDNDKLYFTSKTSSLRGNIIF